MVVLFEECQVSQKKSLCPIDLNGLSDMLTKLLVSAQLTLYLPYSTALYYSTEQNS